MSADTTVAMEQQELTPQQQAAKELHDYLQAQDQRLTRMENAVNILTGQNQQQTVYNEGSDVTMPQPPQPQTNPTLNPALGQLAIPVLQMLAKNALQEPDPWIEGMKAAALRRDNLMNTFMERMLFGEMTKKFGTVTAAPKE